MDKPCKTRTAQPFALMLTDLTTLDWVQVKSGDIDAAREAFKKFHGREVGRQFAVYACHPETKWDGAGGFTVPAGQWCPVLVATNGKAR